LTTDQIKELFFKYTRQVLSQENAVFVWEGISKLDEIDELSELLERLIFPE
jgi:hypothetical protein